MFISSSFFSNKYSLDIRVLKKFLVALVRFLSETSPVNPWANLILQDVVISKKMSESWGHLLRREAFFCCEEMKTSRSLDYIYIYIAWFYPKLAKNLHQVSVMKYFH